MFVTASPGFHFVFSVLARRLAGKSVSAMAFCVSSGTLNLNSVNQSFVCADAELKNCGMITRKPSTPLKPFLLDARQTGYPLEGARLDLVEQFANCYEHARHDPAVSVISILSLQFYWYHFTCC